MGEAQVSQGALGVFRVSGVHGVAGHGVPADQSRQATRLVPLDAGVERLDNAVEIVVGLRPVEQ